MDVIDNLMQNIEGVYSNDPDDRGGETVYGISRYHHPEWIGWIVVDRYKTIDGDLKELIKGSSEVYIQAYEFYDKHYMAPFMKIAYSTIQDELFDTAVNMGLQTAKKMLQEALNLMNRNEKLFDDLVVDGIIGDKTIEAFLLIKPERLLKVLNGLQFMRYHYIATKDPTQEKFFAGWMRRV